MKRIALLVVLAALLGGALYLMTRGKEGAGGRSPFTVAGGAARDRATARVEEGEALEQLDRLEEAEAAYREATGIDSTFGLAFLRLGAIRLVQGDFDSARGLIETAKRLDPKLSGAHFNAGFIYEEDGILDAAEAAYREAVRLDSTNADAYNNLGYLLTRGGRAAEAIPILETGRRRDPDSPFLAKNLGRAYTRVGEWAKARPLLERLFREDAAPVVARDPEVIADLACVLRALGDERKAVDLFRRYLAVQPDPVKRADAQERFMALAARKS